MGVGQVCLQCGLSGLMHVQILLTQHLLAVAARFLLRCNLRRGSGHSMVPITVNFKPILRSILFKFTHCGFLRHSLQAQKTDRDQFTIGA